MSTYYEALKKVTGIIVWQILKLGNYISDLLRAWKVLYKDGGNYLRFKHGGNTKLLILYNQKGDEYFEKYFNYSLIEYFGLSYDSFKKNNESNIWKCVFQQLLIDIMIIKVE